jgi:hypothetical protein
MRAEPAAQAATRGNEPVRFASAIRALRRGFGEYGWKPFPMPQVLPSRI